MTPCEGFEPHDRLSYTAIHLVDAYLHALGLRFNGLYTLFVSYSSCFNPCNMRKT
ncbi:hypothetical protein VPHK469_0221 [Vibrio phage K469]